MSDEYTDTEQYSEQPPQREEWMHLADLVPGSFINEHTTQDTPQSNYNDYDRQNDKLKYPDRLLGEMPSWVNSTKATFQVVMSQQNIDINTFSERQRQAYNLIKAHSQQTSPKDPLLLIVNGVAGTGKSYLINSIRNLLQTSCAITTTTGKAAYSINGQTIHSLLKIPVGSKRKQELTGQALIRLQNNLQEINYIIIDEYSMLGQTTFGWIDRRCRQATGITDNLFDSQSIILAGDCAQLPPVGDKPLYHCKPSSSLGEQGYLAYLMFTMVIILSVNQ